MPEQRRLPLRVLYTINGSPQYILARSLGPVAVTAIDDTVAELQPYGSVSLKTCLETICRSSPELVHDSSRDFSVYVLDPLESNSVPAPMEISNSANGPPTESSCSSNTSHPRGVAVGMGLMSWALSADETDAVAVVGTFAKTSAGQEAVEVIFALRETVSMDKNRDSTPRSRSIPRDNPHNQLHSVISSSNSTVSLSSSQGNNLTASSTTLATIASIQMRAKAKTKQKKAPRVSSTPMTESDKLLNANTYIGPLKKKGRPKGSSTADVKVKAEEPALSVPCEQIVPSAATAPTPIETSTTIIQSAATNANSSSQTPELASSEPDLASIAAILSAAQNEAAQNATLLAALNLIDTPADQNGSQTPVNPALVDALRQILANVYSNAQAQAQHSSPLQLPAESTTQAIPVQPTPDEDVVFLDKENVNPIMFRRRAEREYEEAKLSGTTPTDNPPTVLPAGQQLERPAPQNRGLGARFVENSPPKTRPSVPTLSGRTSPVQRKRTLSEFMDEIDSSRKPHRSKVKGKERLDRRELPRSIYSQQGYENARHYSRILSSTLPRPESGTNYYRTPLNTWTSPPRKPRSPDSGGTSRHRPIVIPDSPQAERVSASSPIRPTHGPRKPYIVPEWARTGTTTQPRLSEDTQRALEAAEEKRREERRLNRRKSNAASQGRARLKARSVSVQDTSRLVSESLRLSQTPKSLQAIPQPVSVKRNLPPIIASSDTGLILVPSSDQRTRSPSPSPRPSLVPPVTPKRQPRVALFTPGTSGYGGDSLFTPSSAARHPGGTAGSLLSPGALGSPLPRKKFRLSSPTSYRGATEQLGSESSTATVKATENSEDDSGQFKNSLQDELDEALDDIDCPPSSLPIASSDIDIDETNTQSLVDNNSECDQDEEDIPQRKQHWIGLPPSSPPPPTSPALMPLDGDDDIVGDDMDDTDLPVASETDEADGTSRDTAVLSVTESDWAPSPGDDVTAPISDFAATPDVEQESHEDFVLFEQYTDMTGEAFALPIIGDDPNMSDDLGTIVPNDMAANMDFSEFWESFRALLPQEGSAPNNSEQMFEFNLDGLIREGGSLPPEELDPNKLAEDVQALFSGCLV